MSSLEASHWPLGNKDSEPDPSNRALHIPDEIQARLIEHGTSLATVHYIGPLAINRGFECEVDPVTPEEIKRFNLPTERTEPKERSIRIKERRARRQTQA